MAVRKVCIGDFLNKSSNWVEPEPDQTYKQITARLWGKGLTLRAEVAGSQIAAARQLRVKAGQFLVSRIDARHGAFGIIPPSLDGALVRMTFRALISTRKSSCLRISRGMPGQRISLLFADGQVRAQRTGSA